MSERVFVVVHRACSGVFVLSPSICSKIVCLFVGPRLACAGTVFKSDSTKSVQRNICNAVKRLQLLGKRFYQMFS
jgi:hypothetical protein